MPDETERKTLVACTFLAGCLALAPQEWTSGIALIVASVVLFFAELRLTAREAELVSLLESWVAPAGASPADPAAPTSSPPAT